MIAAVALIFGFFPPVGCALEDLRTFPEGAAVFSMVR